MPMLGVHQNRQSKARKDAPRLRLTLEKTIMFNMEKKHVKYTN